MHPFQAARSRQGELKASLTASAAKADKQSEAAHDAQLVKRCKAGDESAFTEIIKRYYPRIRALAQQTLHNDADAEEVAQDTFIRAHRGLANFRGDASLATWLYCIGLNLARNRYWYWWRRKRDQSVSIDAPFGADNDMTLAEVIPAEVETPDDITVTQEFIDRIGVERAMWSTDFPHNESTYGYTTSSLQNVVDTVGATAAQAIVSDNVRRYLGLGER